MKLKKNNREKHHLEKSDPQIKPALRWQEAGGQLPAEGGTCRGLRAASEVGDMFSVFTG